MAKSKIRRKPKRSPQTKAAENKAKAKPSVIKIAVVAGLVAAAGWSRVQGRALPAAIVAE